MPEAVSKFELLAPAGGWAQLHAALQAGADAVYLGTGGLNMRARGGNFDPQELPSVVKTIHLHGKRAYLTLNSLVLESELNLLPLQLSAAVNAGIDAVIAADWAVVHAARELGLPVHASTQLSLANHAALRFAAAQGIHRVVLARECGLPDLVSMRQSLEQEKIKMNFEVFVHGAMCVAVSGRCFLSAFETGRSASRGDCAQPCRRRLELHSERGGEGFHVEENGHLLSAKDLCTLPFLDQLLDAGVTALKIEGRNRSPDYVHEVVAAYREAVDVYRAHRDAPDFRERFDQAVQQGLQRVHRVYHRGFSSGFYLGRPLKSWQSAPGNQSTWRRSYIGSLFEHPDPDRVTVRLESEGVQEGDSVFVEGPETGYRELILQEMLRQGQPVQTADKGEKIAIRLDKPMHPGDRMYRYSAIR